jgi:hypothetical protein
MKKHGENLKKWKKKWVKLKLKLNSQPTQYWKNKFNKDNLKKKTSGGNTVAKQKPCKANTVVIHSIFFFKSYKANLSTSSIYKKNRQRLSKKKESILDKRNEKKMYKKGNKSEKKTRRESYSVLKKKTKKLKFQPA